MPVEMLPYDFKDDAEQRFYEVKLQGAKVSTHVTGLNAGHRHHVANVLKQVRRETDWGDGSPTVLDRLIKEYDTLYDPVRFVELNRLDS